MLVEKNPLTERLLPLVWRIVDACNAGDEKAAEIVKLYQLYVACPSDRAAAVFCDEALTEWLAQGGK